MYGLVNRAVESLVRREHGDDVWRQVRALAGVETESFTRMHTYDDSVTYALVEAASATLDVPAEDLLRAFGHHWVRYVATEGYGPLMELGGATLEAFLANLDALHARVSMTYPELRPPSFRLETRPDGVLLLHYHSSRAGLAPMVVGLVEGLAERFGTTAEVRRLDPDGADHERFEIRVHT